MTYFIIGIVVGTVVGWHLPQPQWAKDLTAKIVAKVKSKLDKQD